MTETESPSSQRLAQALALIDKENAQDPNLEPCTDGLQPKELVYGQRMSKTLASFQHNPSEALQIAVRAQHIRRWHIPRSDYDMNKAGYKKWRTDLARYHAEFTGKLLHSIGYDENTVSQVQSILQKKQLKRDPEAQSLEDVACLVFLEFHLDVFAQKHDEPKIIDIIQKTWKKMSSQGQTAALQLPLSPATSSLITKALQK